MPNPSGLTIGFDWADGIDGRIGTKTPDGALIRFTPLTDNEQPIEEMEDSPELERGEQATCTHRWTMSYDTAKQQIVFYGRGTVVTDSYGNIFKVLTSKIQRNGRAGATFTMVSESVSFDTPPDEFQIVPVELGVNIIKYPRYFYAFLGDGEGEDTELLNQCVIRSLQNYFENPTAAYRDALSIQLYYSLGYRGDIVDGTAVPEPPYNPYNATTRPKAPNTTIYPLPGTDLAKAAAIEIIQKYWRNEETPYVIGYQITWSVYYFRSQYLNPGGYVENPITEANPQLPDYFWSPNYPVPNATIFDLITHYNPQCYSENGLRDGPLVLSWLRKADQYEYQRTWFKVDRTWIGSPVGFWDPQLYNSEDRPRFVNDYLISSVPSLTDASKAQLAKLKTAS